MILCKSTYCLITWTPYLTTHLKHSSSKRNRPFYISAKDASPLPLTGLWESKIANEVIITSCKILTTRSNELMLSIHALMPIILPLGAWNTWLSSSPLSADVLMLFL
ncbi:SOS response-associated peptidase family protein [Nitrosomonas communis]|uniref:SOS response-associated peptidase family protein n=1 Tax=Nitrosomonas communis TaxID=44574 RepID=UPI000942D198